MEIAEVILDKSVSKKSLAQTRDGRYEAFASHHPDQAASFRVYFMERGTGKVYEVRGLPLPHRPFSALRGSTTGRWCLTAGRSRTTASTMLLT